ncbi:MAG: MBL fold metallo-hydrolase [Synergistaceae bacterium]|jgi:ribonuclease Z|nr:MBL fold metallo-hydrolase [Synergistaceae bacterium]
MDRLVVLGTGFAIVTKYYNTCFLLDNGDEYFLVDAGGGSEILKLFEVNGLDWKMLHNAYLSHEHIDHILGMIWVIRYVASLMREGEFSGDFRLFCNGELIQKIRAICELTLWSKDLELIGQRIHFIEVRDGEGFDILSYHFTFFDIHSTKAKQFGFRMDYGSGDSLGFLGDEPYSRKCKKYLRNIKWVLSEALCLYSERNIYNPYELHHSTVKDACDNARELGAGNLVLWHTEDKTTFGRRKELYTKEAREYFNGNIVVPNDGEIIYL